MTLWHSILGSRETRVNETAQTNFSHYTFMYVRSTGCVCKRDRETETKKEAYVEGSNFVVNLKIFNHILWTIGVECEIRNKVGLVTLIKCKCKVLVNFPSIAYWINLCSLSLTNAYFKQFMICLYLFLSFYFSCCLHFIPVSSADRVSDCTFWSVGAAQR